MARTCSLRMKRPRSETACPGLRRRAERPRRVHRDREDRDPDQSGARVRFRLEEPVGGDLDWKRPAVVMRLDKAARDSRFDRLDAEARGIEGRARRLIGRAFERVTLAGKGEIEIGHGEGHGGSGLREGGGLSGVGVRGGVCGSCARPVVNAARRARASASARKGRRRERGCQPAGSLRRGVSASYSSGNRNRVALGVRCGRSRRVRCRPTCRTT